MAVKNITFAANSDFAATLVAFEAEKLAKRGLGNGKEVAPEKKVPVAPALLAPVVLPSVDTFDFSAFINPSLDIALESSKALLAQAAADRKAKLDAKEAKRVAEIEAAKLANAAKRDAGFAAQRSVAACAWEKVAVKAATVLAQAESLRSGAMALATQVANVNGRVNALKQKAQTKGLTSVEAQQGAALMAELTKVSAEANAAKLAFDVALGSARVAQETAMGLFTFDARKGVDCFVDQLLEAQQLSEAERLLDLAVHFGQSAEFAGLSNLLGAVKACRNSGKEWVRKDLKGQVVETAPVVTSVVVVRPGTVAPSAEKAAKLAAEREAQQAKALLAKAHKLSPAKGPSNKTEAKGSSKKAKR